MAILRAPKNQIANRPARRLHRIADTTGERAEHEFGILRRKCSVNPSRIRSLRAYYLSFPSTLQFCGSQRQRNRLAAWSSHWPDSLPEWFRCVLEPQLTRNAVRQCTEARRGLVHRSLVDRKIQRFRFQDRVVPLFENPILPRNPDLAH